MEWILRVLLICAGFGWVISVFGIFMPWPFVTKQLMELGANELPADPMLNYWLRMTAGAFTFIGVLFFIMAVKPQRYIPVIKIAGGFLVIEGIILGIAGLSLKLFFIPYSVDSLFCFLTGVGILAVTYPSNKKPT
jgi:hypothetical protein